MTEALTARPVIERHVDYRAEAIPEEMRTRKRWCVAVVRDGKKIPSQALSSLPKAASNRPREWTSFDRAKRFAESRNLPLCFVLGDGIGAIDFDRLIADGLPEATVVDVMQAAIDAGAYIETSVSGRGAHIIGALTPDDVREVFPELAVKPDAKKANLWLRGSDPEAHVDLLIQHFLVIGTPWAESSPEIVSLRPVLHALHDAWKRCGWEGPRKQEQSKPKPSCKGLRVDNVDELKRAARGRWPEVFSRVAGFEAPGRDGSPCPRCGGTDRFHTHVGFEESGAVGCRHCVDSTGDGLGAVRWFTGWDFPTVLSRVAEFLGLSYSPPRSRKADRAKVDVKEDPEDQRPNLQLGPDEHLTVAEAMEHLAKHPALYVSNGRFARVAFDGARLAIEPLSRVGIRLAMSSSVRCIGASGDRIQVPDRLCDSIEASLDPAMFRQLTGVTRSPVLRRDGTVLTDRGWDAKSGLFFEPLPSELFEPFEPTPSVEAAIAARRQLEGLVAEFPWRSESDRAGWLSLVCSLAARRMFDRVPLHALSALTVGSGKTLLAMAAVLIATGQRPPVLPFNVKDQELDKRIGGKLAAGDSVTLFDNVTSKLEGESLASLMTGDFWETRLNFDRQVTRFDVRQLSLIVTGNGLRFGDDFPRRTLLIQLKGDRSTVMRQPESFAIPNLGSYIVEHRPALLRACWTIVTGYQEHLRRGGARVRLETGFVSFEDWSAIIRESLVWCGSVDPVPASREALAERDVDAELQALLLDAVEDVAAAYGGAEVRRQQIVDAANDVSAIGRSEACRSLGTAIGGHWSRLDQLLARWRDADSTDGRVLRGRKGGGNRTLWRVERIGQIEEGGCSDA